MVVSEKKPYTCFDQGEAEKFHISGKPYSVVFTENESVIYVLDITKNDGKLFYGKAESDYR